MKYIPCCGIGIWFTRLPVPKHALSPDCLQSYSIPLWNVTRTKTLPLILQVVKFACKTWIIGPSPRAWDNNDRSIASLNPFTNFCSASLAPPGFVVSCTHSDLWWLETSLTSFQHSWYCSPRESSRVSTYCDQSSEWLILSYLAICQHLRLQIPYSSPM